MLTRRGLFGVVAGVATVPFVEAQAAETIGGSTYARVCWFDDVRGEWKLVARMGDIWLRDTGVKLRPGQEVSVAWEFTRRGYVGHAVWPV